LRAAVPVLALAVAAILAGCGGGGERHDVTEPQGEFSVHVTKAKFPARQRIAEQSDLELEIKNTDTEPLPDVTVTIYTGERKAEGAFNVRLEQPGLANPARPVWILENQYPKVVPPGLDRSQLDNAPGYGVDAGRQNTFQFGELAPGKSIDVVWRVTPVRADTYPVHYQVSAGIEGRARAVTDDGGPVVGQFVVTIDNKPPNTCVTGSGRIVKGRCQF
jgi:hypothetical protein